MGIRGICKLFVGKANLRNNNVINMACAKFLEEKVIDSHIQVVLAKTVDSDLKSNFHGFHARFCLYNMSRLMVFSEGS